MHLTSFFQWVVGELKNPLVLFGFAAQFVFFLRFAVQWAVSEWKGHSHIPVAFWYLSLTGGAMTLVYAILKKDLVFITAQALGIFIYARNLMLIYRPRTAPDGLPLVKRSSDVETPEPVSDNHVSGSNTGLADGSKALNLEIGQPRPHQPEGTAVVEA